MNYRYYLLLLHQYHQHLESRPRRSLPWLLGVCKATIVVSPSLNSCPSVAIRASKLGLAFGPKIMGAFVFLARVFHLFGVLKVGSSQSFSEIRCLSVGICQSIFNVLSNG